MRSLGGRLIRMLTLILALVFVAQWGVLSVAIRQVSERQMLGHMGHDAGAVLATLEADGAGGLRLDERGIEPIYRQPRSGHYYVAQIDGADAFRSISLDGFALATASPDRGAHDHYQTPGPSGEPLLVLVRSERVQGRQVTLFIAEDLGETNHAVLQLSLTSLAAFLPLLLIALMLQGLGVRRALQPLEGVRAQLQEVGAGRHAQITGAVPTEIKPLVDELNRLLLLLQRRLNQSRTALGNLAHALKTPLAVLLRAADDPALAEPAREQLRDQVNVIHERVERELRRARLAGAPGAGAYFNPAAELPVLVKVLGGIYREKAIDFQITAPDKLLPFDREDMLELLGNLADNACKWARATVAITVEEGADAGAPGALRLSVADDGPGCPPQDVVAILQRGARLDETRSGHGLGLAIAQDVVEFYGGQFEIDRDPRHGGLRVRVTLAPCDIGAA